MTTSTPPHNPTPACSLSERFLRLRLETMRLEARIGQMRTDHRQTMDELQQQLRASNAAIDAVIKPHTAIVRFRLQHGVHYQVGNVFVSMVTRPGLSWLLAPVRLTRVLAHHLLVAAIAL